MRLVTNIGAYFKFPIVFLTKLFTNIIIKPVIFINIINFINSINLPIRKFITTSIVLLLIMFMFNDYHMIFKILAILMD